MAYVTSPRLFFHKNRRGGEAADCNARVYTTLSDRSLISSIIPEEKPRHFLLLLILGLAMLLIRIVPVYTRIFTDWPGEYGNFVNFSADDAVYHMRFVHNTLHHFPLRVFFDPFTHFPFGSYIAFGPLFTNIIATVALIIGLGSPSSVLVNHVSAYIPPVMGALCLIPLYFVTCKLFGKTVAMLASFILAFLPGEFLSRSALGFVDHHVAEVLFSTTTCAFLIYALDAHIKNKSNRATLVYGLLAGITFGLFILTWQGAQMFGVIFLVFFITQLIIDHFANKNTDYLLLLVVLVYLPPVIMVLPYIPMYSHFDPTLYPLYIILILPAMAAIFIICYLWHLALKHNKAARSWYLSALIVTFVLLGFVFKKCFPRSYGFVFDGLKCLFHPSAGMYTVGEVQPAIIDASGQLTIQKFWYNFFWTMPMSIIGFGCLSFYVYENRRPAEVFLLVWSLAIVVATCAQIRFNYDLVINAAILAGFGVYYILDLISYAKPKKKLWAKLQKFIFVTLFFVFALLIVDPIILLWMDNKIPSGVQVSRNWYNTLIWLKKHTPNPQGKIIAKNFDYAAGYYPIPKNLNIPYNYPKSAYGVMSWWDVGHQITYIAERIPNSNNYQQGIVEKNNMAGAALFFTSRDEKKAVKNLNVVGSRYIVIANDMLYSKFPGIVIWSGDTEGWTRSINKKTNKLTIESSKFLQTMINRLFYNDADGLQHFRLIYESEGDYLVNTKSVVVVPSAHVIPGVLRFKNYAMALKTVKKLNKVVANKERTFFTYSARLPVKEAKIFEKVKGAVISGEVLADTPDNTQVELMLKLKTKYKRVFTYTQTTKITNGKYQFIVPYPTTKMRGNGYSYDIQAIDDYQIKIKDRIIKVFVPEKAVMIGNIIKVNVTHQPSIIGGLKNALKEAKIKTINVSPKGKI